MRPSVRKAPRTSEKGGSCSGSPAAGAGAGAAAGRRSARAGARAPLPSLGAGILVAVLANLLLRGLVLLSASPYVQAPEDECIYGTVALEMLVRPGLSAYDHVWPYKGGGVIAIHALQPIIALLGSHAVVVKLFSLAVSCIVIALSVLLLDRHAGRRAAAIGAALLILAPPHLVFRSLMTVGDHYLARVFDLLVIALAVRAISSRRPSRRSCLALGAAVGLAAWACYDTVPTSLACIVLVLAESRRRPEAVASIAAGALLGLVPWLSYNISHGFEGLAIVGGNSPAPGSPAPGPAEKLWGLVASDLGESLDFQYLPRLGVMTGGAWEGASWLYLLGLAAGAIAVAGRVLRLRATPLERVLAVAIAFHALAYALGPFVIDDKGLRAGRYLLALYHPLMLLAAAAAGRWWASGRRAAASLVALSLIIPGALGLASLVEPARWGADLDREYPPACWERTAWFIGWRYRADPAALELHCNATVGARPERRFCWWGAGYGAGWEGGPEALGRLPCALAPVGAERVRCLAGALEAVRDRWLTSLDMRGSYGLCAERASDEQACAAAVGAGLGWSCPPDPGLCNGLDAAQVTSCQRGFRLMSLADVRGPSAEASVGVHEGPVTSTLVTGPVIYTGGADGSLQARRLGGSVNVNSVEYLFSWSKVPGTDEELLKRYLRDRSDLELTEPVHFQRADGCEALTVSSGDRWAEFRLPTKGNKGPLGSGVRLRTSNGRDDRLTDWIVDYELQIHYENVVSVPTAFAIPELDRVLSGSYVDNPGGTVYSLASNGTAIFAGSHDGTITVWSLPGLSPLGSWQAHREIVFGLAWNGTSLVSASHDGTIKSWDSATRERLSAANAGQGALTSLAVARGLAVAGGFNGRVVSWDGTSPPRAYTGHEGSVLSVWTDGRLVYTGSMDKVVKVWRADGGRLWFVRTLEGHTSGVAALAGDAELLASVGIDGRVLAWDRGTYAPVLDRAAGTSAYSLALSPDRLFVGLGNGTVVAWPRPGEG